MNVILFFIDGIGVGPNDKKYNPCCYSTTGIFNCNSRKLPQNGKLNPIDACLGIPGIPQSATGQTTIFTGKNASDLIGKHLDGFPNRDLCKLLNEYSMFVELLSEGYRCKFLNAFRPIFFTTPELFKNLKMSSTTQMNRAAGLSFSSLNDIRNGKALYHDYTNVLLKKLGFDLPEFSVKSAAEILAYESKEYDLLLYEYFLTDYAGHSQNMESAISEINKVESLILELLKLLDFNSTSLMVVSDHGNIEDLRTKSHSLNPAFMALWARESVLDSLKCHSLLGVKSLIHTLISK